jgi:hypothetical protein
LTTLPSRLLKLTFLTKPLSTMLKLTFLTMPPINPPAAVDVAKGADALVVVVFLLCCFLLLILFSSPNPPDIVEAVGRIVLVVFVDRGEPIILGSQFLVDVSAAVLVLQVAEVVLLLLLPLVRPPDIVFEVITSDVVLVTGKVDGWADAGKAGAAVVFVVVTLLVSARGKEALKAGEFLVVGEALEVDDDDGTNNVVDVAGNDDDEGRVNVTERITYVRLIFCLIFVYELDKNLNVL